MLDVDAIVARGGWLLSMGILCGLIRKGVLTKAEAEEIVREFIPEQPSSTHRGPLTQGQLLQDQLWTVVEKIRRMPDQ